MEENFFNEKEIKNLEENPRRTFDNASHLSLKNFKNVDLLGHDLEAAKNHGKAQRLLKMNKDILNLALGKLLLL